MSDYALGDRYLLDEGPVLLTGIQALVRVLLDRARHDRSLGRTPATYVSGYEGSPLAGYDLELGRQRALLGRHGVVHQPGLNEELAATAVAGTQIAASVGRFRDSGVRGVTGVWYGKAPGLDRATDAVRHANIAGADPHGGAVALVGDDPSAKSSTIPCSSEPALADLYVPTLYPADPHEVLGYGMHAVELSRASGVWSAVKVATNVADATGTARVTRSWTPPDLADLVESAMAYGHRPHTRMMGAALAALERSLHEVRLPAAVEYVRRSGLNVRSGAGADARYAIVSAGKTWLDVRQALHRLGIEDVDLPRHGIRLLKLGAVWPVEPSVVRALARGVGEVVVVEDKRSFVETQVKEILYGQRDTPRVTGKLDVDGTVLFPASGELDPDLVAAGLARRLAGAGIESVERWRPPLPRRARLVLASRTPYFCSGCPHNTSTKVPDGSIVGAGIGCHAMAVTMPQKQVGTLTGVCQMGGEGAQWIGMAPFVEGPHFVQNVGDGTYAHSASLAVRAAVAAGIDVTYKVLFNSAVAMTGGQPAVGAATPAQVAHQLVLDNVTRVVITTADPAAARRAVREAGRPTEAIEVRPREDILDVQAELARLSGVTVLIHEQECAAQLRRKRKRAEAPTPVARVFVNERVCEGCGDCGEKSNCMSVHPVETPFGRKTRIHQSSCNVDYSCLAGDCPSFLTVVPADSLPARVTAPGREPLPEPVARFAADGFSARITGMGGTGVVTIAQILATAAFLDGLQVRALDQTGLAQKGGAVVSDVTLSAASVDRAAKLASGECCLYLGCDALVAADPTQLLAVDRGRTLAVVSSARVPTGAMVVDTDQSYPAPGQLHQALADALDDVRFIDADALAQQRLGDAQLANMVLLGAAYQLGALPISAASLERAITLNGAQVDGNLAALRIGREAALDQSAATEVAPVSGEGLDALLAVRVPDLAAYQDQRYAAEYAAFVERVRATEALACPGSTALTEAVARYLYKLMAYKDEYEVARLSLDPALGVAIREAFGPGARVAYRLHPPLLRALGRRDKIAFGTWVRPAFATLQGMRRLRGTRWDPFGHTEVRRVERALVGEYRSAVEQTLTTLSPATADWAVEIATLPDLVRGYEHVKLRSVQTFRARLAELLPHPPGQTIGVSASSQVRSA